MKYLKTNHFALFICLLLLSQACQNSAQEGNTKASKEKEYSYTPEKGRLTIVNETANPEIERVSLLRDDEKDSITSVKPEGGKFSLEADDISMNEVYFLKISGTSTKQGTSGLDWEEMVPVLASSGALKLSQQAHQHVGSISKVKFAVNSGGDDQELLNQWHAALVELKAEEEGQLEAYSIGGAGSATKFSAKQGASHSPASITADFVKQQKPLISSLYLISRYGKHRQHADDYRQLLEKASADAKNSKYGLMLAKNLDQLGTKVTHLNLPQQVVATNSKLAEISWDDFQDRKYLLLSFWSSSEASSVEAAKTLSSAAVNLESKGIDVLLISVENQLSTWQETAKGINHAHNYKIRNEAKQALVDTLYLSELPRLVLVKPNGEVINDDLDLDEVQALE